MRTLRRMILMKIIKISLDKIKSNSGVLSVDTGAFNKVNPYYLRQIEDVAVKLFEARTITSSKDSSRTPLDNGGDNA